MVNTLSERLQAFFTGVKPGAAVLTPEKVREIQRAAKAVRSKDYIFYFDIPDGAKGSGEVVVTTTANWFFVMTGAAVHFEETTDDPKIKVTYQDFNPSSPFKSTPQELNAVPAGAVFAKEHNGAGRFEEFKNLWYVLGQRITISAECMATGPARGSLILTGLEFDLQGLENG